MHTLLEQLKRLYNCSSFKELNKISTASPWVLSDSSDKSTDPQHDRNITLEQEVQHEDEMSESVEREMETGSYKDWIRRQFLLLWCGPFDNLSFQSRLCVGVTLVTAQCEHASLHLKCTHLADALIPPVTTQHITYLIIYTESSAGSLPNYKHWEKMTLNKQWSTSGDSQGSFTEDKLLSGCKVVQRPSTFWHFLPSVTVDLWSSVGGTAESWVRMMEATELLRASSSPDLFVTFTRCVSPQTDVCLSNWTRLRRGEKWEMACFKY